MRRLLSRRYSNSAAPPNWGEAIGVEPGVGRRAADGGLAVDERGLELEAEVAVQHLEPQVADDRPGVATERAAGEGPVGADGALVAHGGGVGVDELGGEGLLAEEPVEAAVDHELAAGEPLAGLGGLDAMADGEAVLVDVVELGDVDGLALARLVAERGGGRAGGGEVVEGREEEVERAHPRRVHDAVGVGLEVTVDAVAGVGEEAEAPLAGHAAEADLPEGLVGDLGPGAAHGDRGR